VTHACRSLLLLLLSSGLDDHPRRVTSSNLRAGARARYNGTGKEVRQDPRVAERERRRAMSWQYTSWMPQYNK